MYTRDPNLSDFERALSGLFGITLACVALRSSSLPMARALSAVLGAGLLARAASGHCAVKAALRGQRIGPETIAEPPVVRSAGSQAAALDEALEGSFPASDPPGSRLPDEPPSNVDEMWAAAKAGKPPGRSGT